MAIMLASAALAVLRGLPAAAAAAATAAPAAAAATAPTAATSTTAPTAPTTAAVTMVAAVSAQERTDHRAGHEIAGAAAGALLGLLEHSGLVAEDLVRALGGVACLGRLREGALQRILAPRRAD